MRPKFENFDFLRDCQISLSEKIFLKILLNILNQINQVCLNCHQLG